MQLFRALIVLLVLWVSSVPLVAGSVGNVLPYDANSPATYYQASTGTWLPTMRAMSWNSGSATSDGVINRAESSFHIVNHVSVAQWVEWSISATRKDWRVLRPGTYASGSVEFYIASNNDVNITFYASDPEYMESASVTRAIPKWYAYTIGNDINEVDTNGWFRGGDYTADEPLAITIRDSAALHAGAAYTLWEKIEVVPSNSSSDYEGSGTVMIMLTNMKHWVEPGEGTFYPAGKSPMDLGL